MPSADPYARTEASIKVKALEASQTAIQDVMVTLIKQEARDIKISHPDIDEKELYKRAVVLAEQRMRDAIEAVCNGRRTRK